MPNAFASYPSGEWKSTAQQVKQLLTTEEYESARASTPNAHYTSPQVIDAVWKGMEHDGVA